jgi:hypothetical protein
MLYFPQLITGATSQLPCTKKIFQRTIVNSEPNGGTVKLFDPGACAVEWDMQLSGLTLEEWTALDALFEATEGRLGTFQFLDPFGNLLKWSESPSAATWTKDTGLHLTNGVTDHLGTTRATRLANAGSGEQGLRQSVSVPGWYQYCLSVWARSDSPAPIRLTMTAGTDVSSQWFDTSTTWHRLELSMPLEIQTATAVTFGAAIGAGASVDVFGFQAEPQVGASKYKSTTTHNAVFSNAYFLDDELRMTSNAPGEFSCALRIGAKAS